MQSFNLHFESNEQFVRDMADALVRNHLDWSGSLDGMPSENNGGSVYGWDAYASANLSEEDSVDDIAFERERYGALYREAKKLADRKWLAVLTLLGIEAM